MIDEKYCGVKVVEPADDVGVYSGYNLTPGVKTIKTIDKDEYVWYNDGMG